MQIDTDEWEFIKPLDYKNFTINGRLLFNKTHRKYLATTMLMPYEFNIRETNLWGEDKEKLEKDYYALTEETVDDFKTLMTYIIKTRKYKQNMRFDNQYDEIEKFIKVRDKYFDYMTEKYEGSDLQELKKENHVVLT